MKKYLGSYATFKFIARQRILYQTAIKYKFDYIRSYRPGDLIFTDFYRRHREILKQKRGSGYWLWKPYFILKTLEEMQENDFLLFMDAGLSLIGNPEPLVRECKENDGILLFYSTVISKHWTKRDCFVLMNCDNEEYHKAQQTIGSAICLIKCRNSVDFVREWLTYCADPRILTDKSNTCGLDNLEGFREHRHDQSVLTLLSIRKGIKRYTHPVSGSDQTGYHIDGIIHLKSPIRRTVYGTCWDAFLLLGSYLRGACRLILLIAN